jgi:RimJ/RimL family protein N-acetyltransferase
LRSISAEDAEALYAYHQLFEVARYQYWSERSREEVAGKIDEWVKKMQAEAPEAFTLAVIEKETGELIGDCCLQVTDAEARQGEIGYSFHPRSQGRGYGRETAMALLGFGFDQCGLHRIVARCDARNAPSWKLSEAIGMRREAHFLEHALFKGEWDEEYYYAMLEDEWRNRKADEA